MTNGPAPHETIVFPATNDGIAAAASALLAGRLVAFPTETVFGLGAVVSNEAAVKGIFRAKGRPADHPLIAHVANVGALADWVRMPLPQVAQLLINRYWPGPLTLVLPKSHLMPAVVTGGQDTVGVRCPSHPVAQALLQAVGIPVAAPSANRFGRVSPTCVAHVQDELDGRIDAILEGDPSEVGIESTIVAIVGEDVVLLRPGSISAKDIESLIGRPVKRQSQVKAMSDLRVSGNLEQHYSPQADISLVDLEVVAKPTSESGASLGSDPVVNQLQLAIGQLQNQRTPIKVRVVGWSQAWLKQAQFILESESTPRANFDVVSLVDSATEVAHELYATLRQADHDGVTHLLIEKPPQSVAWEGVADRLRRASA